MRYRLVYSKRGEPMSRYFSDQGDAEHCAAMYEAQGYNTNIWSESQEGARPLYGWSSLFGDVNG